MGGSSVHSASTINGAGGLGSLVTEQAAQSRAQRIRSKRIKITYMTSRYLENRLEVSTAVCADLDASRQVEYGTTFPQP